MKFKNIFSFVVLTALAAFVLSACSGGYSVGDKVFAEWTPDSWYSGVVDSTCEEGWKVVFDDGDSGCYGKEKIVSKVYASDPVAVGAKVLANWTSTHFYSGVVKSLEEDGTYTVEWYDGTTKAGLKAGDMILK